ncbi:rod shape-determining protein MreD [bacterium]|nr:rod shape-determining protein MreD [bacterium]
MKRRWSWIALAIAVILQATIVPYMSLNWFRPDITLIVLVYMAVRIGVLESMGAAFAAGLLIDSLSAGFMGLSSLSYAVAVYTAGKLFYYEVPLPTMRWMSAMGVAVVLYAVIFSVFYTLNAQPGIGRMLLVHAFPTAAYTWVLAALWSLTPLYERREGYKL